MVPAPTRPGGSTMHIHRLRSSRLGALAIALLLVLVTACGGNEADEIAEDPEGSLRDAVEAVGEWQGIALELRIEADEAGQQALLTEGDMTQEDLDLLLDGRVVATIANLDDPETNSLETRVVLDGTDVLEFRVTEDRRFFVRVDLQSLRESSDEELLTQDDIDELVASAEMMGVGDAGRALAESGWIELTGIEQLMALAGVQQDDTEETDQATAERIAERASTFIDEDVTVTTVGSDEIGERVRATTDGASLQRFLDDISAEIDDGGLVDEAGGGDLTSELSDNDVVSLDAWIEGGELRQIAIDLASLDEEMELDGEVWLIVTMEEFTGSIAEPDEATTLDVFSLVGAFFGGGMDGGFDDFGDDGFEDDGFDDGFEDDGFTTEEEDVVDESTDEGFGEDDGFDEGTDDGFGEDDGFGDEGATECITQEELDEIEQFLGEEGLEEIQGLIDAGILEVC
jgi:hypothetical protein